MFYGAMNLVLVNLLNLMYSLVVRKIWKFKLNIHKVRMFFLHVLWGNEPSFSEPFRKIWKFYIIWLIKYSQGINDLYTFLSLFTSWF